MVGTFFWEENHRIIGTGFLDLFNSFFFNIFFGKHILVGTFFFRCIPSTCQGCRVALNRALTAPVAAMEPSLMDDQSLEFSLLEAILFQADRGVGDL